MKKTLITASLFLSLASQGQNLKEVYRADSIHTPLELYRSDLISQTRVYNESKAKDSLILIKDKRISNCQNLVDTIQKESKKKDFLLLQAKAQNTGIRSEWAKETRRKKKVVKVAILTTALLILETYFILK